MDYTKLRQRWVDGDYLSSQQSNIGEEAFQEALATFAAELNFNPEKVSFASKTTSSTDVLDVVCEAQLKYQSSKTTKAWKWLNRVSQGVVYYSNIFDVLVQHHPEYVSLAWGAMKFLFVVSYHLSHRSVLGHLTL